MEYLKARTPDPRKKPSAAEENERRGQEMMMETIGTIVDNDPDGWEDGLFETLIPML